LGYFLRRLDHQDNPQGGKPGGFVWVGGIRGREEPKDPQDKSLGDSFGYFRNLNPADDAAARL
jgi:hypothetical protein